jgi:hypothetical protein
VPELNFGDPEASRNKVLVRMQHKFDKFTSQITVTSGLEVLELIPEDKRGRALA